MTTPTQHHRSAGGCSTTGLTLKYTRALQQPSGDQDGTCCYWAVWWPKSPTLPVFTPPGEVELATGNKSLERQKPFLM